MIKITITNEEIYEKLLEIEKKFETHHIKFTSLEEWKTYIWDNCPYRKQKDTGDKEIDFLCEKTNQLCHFNNCPENIIRKNY